MRFSEIKVTYKKSKDLPVIDSVERGVQIFREVWDMQMFELQERVYVLFLSPSMQLLGWKMINAGTASETLVDAELILRLALTSGSKKIVIAHNHPSGTNSPSSADKRMTIELKKKIEFIGLELTDHLILTKNNYYSFSENNLL